MLQEWVILLVSFCYLGILFAVAYFADKRADQGRSLISNPYIYTLSIAVYCTAWTFYGSVGRAATTGVGFLPIYLGPTLMAALWFLVLRKIIRISKVQRITSIADFISSRYAKDPVIGGLVTIIAVVGILPYISIQLKAVSTSFNILHSFDGSTIALSQPEFIWKDTALYVTLAMSAFTILFGTRHIDASERHEGMVAAVAFESIVKLIVFLIAGIFISYYLFSGPAALIHDAVATPRLSQLMQVEALNGGYSSWFSLTFLSMMAILFLPRQFHILVVENVNEDHVRTASWLFPLYLLLINVFVLPISLAGLLTFPANSVDPDTFVLTVPLFAELELVALLVFIGGLSAATGMVIVATVALSTMVCNDLVMPVLLRIRSFQQRDLSRTLLTIRRGAIIFILLLSYVFFRLIGESYTLVTLGLVSFAAAAQFAPPILMGIFWKDASRKAAVSALSGGFIVWAYTLLLPSFALSGWLPQSFIESGPFGLKSLSPYTLFGLEMFDPVTHSVFWSMLVNISLLTVVSLFDKQSAIERIQAVQFVDVFRHDTIDSSYWSGTATVRELKDLMARFLGTSQANEAFAEHLAVPASHAHDAIQADAELVRFTERKLAGAIGAASARVMISTVVKGEDISISEIMKILDETSQVIGYSKQLEEKSQQLEQATAELRAVNRRLTELDRLKDEFVSTVTHELRTPLTSIRAFSEILHDNTELDEDKRHAFLEIIVKESERLTRLINQVLDLAKLEPSEPNGNRHHVHINGVITEAVASMSQVFQENEVQLQTDLSSESLFVMADRDRIIQVLINLLSNAVKFCNTEDGKVMVFLSRRLAKARVEICDNGQGIPKKEHKRIFEKFHQLRGIRREKPEGSGLGLAICHSIIASHGGEIWVESEMGKGSRFIFELHLNDSEWLPPESHLKPGPDDMIEE